MYKLYILYFVISSILPVVTSRSTCHSTVLRGSCLLYYRRSTQGSLYNSDWKGSLAECVTNQAISPQQQHCSYAAFNAMRLTLINFS